MDLQDEKVQTPIGDESNILERVARIISSVRGAKPDYAHLAAELEPALPFDIFGIVLLRHDGEAVRITVCQRDGEQWVARYRQHPLVDSMVERLLPSLPCHEAGTAEGALEDVTSVLRQQLLVKNFPEGATGLPAECGDALCGHPRLRAALIAPLCAGGKVLGTLELGSVQLDAYADPALQRLINALASLLATAIESAVAGGNVEIQNRQRAELKDVSTVLTTAVDLPMILQRIVLGITNSLHVSSAIVRIDQGQCCLRLEAHSGLYFDPNALQMRLAEKNALSDQAIIGATLLRRQKQVTQDIAQDERFPESRWFASELSVRSIFCYPLVNGQYVYGALLLLSSEPGGFTPLKTDICALFAGQATVAIHNGMLLQSVQERRRFQEIIEQLERAHQQNVFLNQDEFSEAELLQRVSAQTLNTFGVSLSSVLHFISEHLLTRSERHLQEILRTAQTEMEEERLLGALGNEAAQLPVSSGAEGTLFLMQSAETALASTDLLRDISAALMRALRVDEEHPQVYEQLKRELAEPWFIVDLMGRCIYLNRAAEMFCGIRTERDQASTWQRLSEESSPLFGSFHPLPTRQETPLTLEQALAPLLPRVREKQEVVAYLRDFISTPGEQETLALPVFLHCTLAADVLANQETWRTSTRESVPANSAAKTQEPRMVIPPPTRSHSSPSMLLDSAPSDHHYQFVQHTLYNEDGQCFANALHIHDVTEQVRDEKNKAVLLASVSHDLRTPLTSIKAAVTGLLQPDILWDESIRREMLEDIDAEADHLNALVNSLVEMSQIEMGALVLDKEWCDVAEVVHMTLLRCQRMLADFTVLPSIQKPLPQIHADYVQLERVLRNLLENVARYSSKHTKIRVLVDVPGLKAPPGLSEALAQGVRVQIIDQGPGIPEEERERIFKSFYSLTPQGNGLGLAICRGIVEAHQGRIWVEAAVGGGACFVFVLPVTS
ncbi:MAG: ATP-binding protein [Ktedonobacteraceae bacterium]